MYRYFEFDDEFPRRNVSVESFLSSILSEIPVRTLIDLQIPAASFHFQPLPGPKILDFYYDICSNTKAATDDIPPFFIDMLPSLLIISADYNTAYDVPPRIRDIEDD